MYQVYVQKRIGRVRQLGTVSRIVHDNHQINIPVHWTSNSDSKILDITWDPAQTDLTSAELYVRVYSDSQDTYLDYWVNNNKGLSFAWPTFGGGVWIEDRKDVLAWVRNGRNDFRAEYVKSFWFPTAPNAYVNATLTLNFTGQPPDVSPPQPPFDPWQLALYGGLAIAAMFGVGYLITAWRKKEKT